MYYALIVAQSASLLGRILPPMIGHLIPEDNENWECFLKLVQILRMLLSSIITRDETYHLEILSTTMSSPGCTLTKD